VSEPKRYDPPDTLNGESFMQQVEGGDYIRYEDYARLRSVAEDNKTECEATRIENARLKAEVERLKEDNRQLTKAFEIAEGIIKRMGKAAEDAAKEGKQP